MINILPNEIAEKIAAGEVVENPASVVKELIENAIDSGATSITCETKNGGRTYIRVTDNGCGMNKEDAEKCFMRHATSKITELDDLYNISTMGFRGEALYAISAVSEISITTKTNDTDAVKSSRAGGEVFPDVITSHPIGTTVEVSNLFFNTPARLKFLKSDKYEQIAINQVMEKLAIIHTNISFKLIVDGVEKLNTNGKGDLTQTIYSVFGEEYAKNIKLISYLDGGIRISGCIGGIETHRATRSMQFSFVNSRYIKSSMIGKAVEEAFQDRLMHGKHPFFIINIEVNPSEVDVNIHPQKLEAKFSHNGEVYKAIYWSVKNVLEEKQSSVSYADSSFRKEPDRDMSKSPLLKGGSDEVAGGLSLQEQHVEVTFPQRSQENVPIFRSTPFEIQVAEPLFVQSAMQVAGEAEKVLGPPEYRLIGQVFGTYILVEKDDKFIMIDQHAADERRLYDKLIGEQKVNTQLIMGGLSFSFTAEEKERLLDNSDILESIGFTIEDFGDNNIVIRAVPDDFSQHAIKEMLEEFSVELKNSENLSVEKLRDRLHFAACKSAVKGDNDKLTPYEMGKIADWVFSQSDWQTCPHGRPVVKELTKHEIDKMFKRIV